MTAQRIQVTIDQPVATAEPRQLEKFSRIERDISNLFDRLFAPAHPFRPAAEGWWHPFTDIYEGDTQFIVRMELAGVDASRLEVVKEGRCLVVRGLRLDPFAAAPHACHQLEISYGAFERVVCLPVDFAAEAVHADYGSSTGFFEIRIDKELP